LPEGPITLTPADAAMESPGPGGPEAESSESSTGPAGPIGSLPRILAPIPPAEAMDRLSRASKRGKLPGFEQRDGDRFRTLVYGEPFDRELLGSIRPGAEGCEIDLQLRLIKKMPVIMIALIVVSIWPGVWLTDSMIQTYFPGYPNSFWVTAAWYLPLTVIPLPWVMRRVWLKSEGVAREELGKAIDKIVRAVDGTVG
jgi:hypothetical protein